MHRESTPRHRLAIPVSLALALLAAGAAAADKKTGVKFERDADFSRYRTYEVLANPAKPEGSPMAVGGETDTKIRNAIDRQLRAQGFEPATAGEPDFLVSFDGAMEAVTDIEGLRQDISTGVAWVMEGSINSYRQGTLIISIRDAGSEKTVWSAWTTEKVKDPQNPGKQIDKAVKKLLKKFPPK